MKLFFLVLGYKFSVVWRILNDFWFIKYYKFLLVIGFFFWFYEIKIMMKSMVLDNFVIMVYKIDLEKFIIYFIVIFIRVNILRVIKIIIVF